MIKDALMWYQRHTHHERFVDYLKQRAIPLTVAQHYGLGWSIGYGLARYLVKQYAFDEVRRFGLITEFDNNLYDLFYVDGVVVPIGCAPIYQYCIMRCYTTVKHRRYINMRGRNTSLFNEQALLSGGTVYVTEGVFDAITLGMLGYEAVAILGAMRSSNVLLQKLAMADVVLCFDNDVNKTGFKAMLSLASKLFFEFKRDVRIILFRGDDYRDLNQMLVDNDYVSIERRLRFVVPYSSTEHCVSTAKRLEYGQQNQVVTTRDIATAWPLYLRYVRWTGYENSKFFRCLCPFHDESNGSFTVYKHDASFYCFGCGRYGFIESILDAARAGILKEVQYESV